MPYVFLDHAADNDIAIYDSSNWIINDGELPNGDNCAEKINQTGMQTIGVIGTNLEIVARDTALCFWIRPHTDWGTGQLLIGTGLSSQSDYLISVSTNGTGGTPTKAILNIATNRGIAVNPQLTFDEWHYVVIHARTNYNFSTSSSGFINTYIDGVSGPSTSVGSNSFRPGTATALSGIHLIGPSVEGLCDIAKLAWFNDDLTSGEVTTFYNAMVAA